MVNISQVFEQNTEIAMFSEKHGLYDPKWSYIISNAPLLRMTSGALQSHYACAILVNKRVCMYVYMHE